MGCDTNVGDGWSTHPPSTTSSPSHRLWASASCQSRTRQAHSCLGVLAHAHSPGLSPCLRLRSATSSEVLPSHPCPGTGFPPSSPSLSLALPQDFRSCWLYLCFPAPTTGRANMSPQMGTVPSLAGCQALCKLLCERLGEPLEVPSQHALRAGAPGQGRGLQSGCQWVPEGPPASPSFPGTPYRALPGPH